MSKLPSLRGHSSGADLYRYFSGSRFGLVFTTHLTRGLGDVLGARKTNTATIVKKDMFDIQV